MEVNAAFRCACYFGFYVNTLSEVIHLDARKHM